MKIPTRSLLAVLLAVSYPLSTLTLHAQESASSAIEEIIVTGTKRESSIQDVPFSINAQTQKDIERTAVKNIEELSRNVAGLTVQNLGPGQSQVAIRGVAAGQIVRDQPGVKEQVGIYVDESVISLSLFTPDLDLYDLNRVETLRGPQGTLFGSGSVGGTIRYITNGPDTENHDGALEADLNGISDGEVGGHIKGFYNTPFAGGALRIVGYHTEFGGFIDALGPAAGEDVNSGSRSGGRIAAKFDLSSNWSITPRVIFQTVDTDGFNRAEIFNFLAAAEGTEIGEREQFLLQREAFEDDTLIADVKLEGTFGAVDFISITSFTDRDILVARDASALTHSVSVDFGVTDPVALAIPSQLNDTTDLSQITQEFRFSSAGDEVFDWLVGAFYSDTARDYAQRLPTPGIDAFFDVVIPDVTGVDGLTSADVANGFPADSPFNSDIPFDLEQISLFGEINYLLSDSWDLTVGGRFYDFDETRTITSGGIFAAGDTGVVDETSSSGFTPRVLLKYAQNDAITWNAQISQGFRLGGVNDPLNVTLCQGSDIDTFGGFQSFDDESLTNFEVGFKGAFDFFSVNAAVYHADIEDLQVTVDAGTCSSRVSFNVPEASSTGVELEAQVQPSDNFSFSVAASFLEAEFDSTVEGIVDGELAVLEGIEDGNRIPTVPEFSAAVSATYVVPLGDANLAFSATLQHVGDRITQPGDQVEGAGIFVPGLPVGELDGTEVIEADLELPSYNIVNFNASYETDRWSATLYLTNAFDEIALQSFDRERDGRARIANRVNQPRTVGVTYRVNF